MQSKKASLTESAVNTGLGFVISLGATAAILPAFGLHTSFATQTNITIVYTVISLVRGYALRRAFNWYERKQVI